MPASVEAESIWRDIGKARTEKVSLLSAMQVKLMVSILLEAVEQWWRGGGGAGAMPVWYAILYTLRQDATNAAQHVSL